MDSGGYAGISDDVKKLRLCEQIVGAGRKGEKNLDGATVAYFQLTLQLRQLSQNRSGVKP